MTSAQIIRLLSKNNIKLYVEQGDLKFKAPKGALTADLKQLIVEHKAELIQLLTAQSAESEIIHSVERAPAGNAISANQRRLWLTEQFQPGSNAYCIFSCHTIEGLLDVARLESAIHATILRHEALRTHFKQIDEVVLAQVQDLPHWQLPLIDFSQHDFVTANALADEQIQQQLKQLFALEYELPIRVCLFRISNRNHKLLIILHHLVADGWSMAVFVRDLMQYYLQGDAAELPLLPIQYIDYAEWLNSKLAGASAHQSWQYWQQRLAGVPNLELPYKANPPKFYQADGKHRIFQLPNTVSAKLRKLALRLKVTEFSIYFSLYAVLLWRYARQTDFCIGLPSSGRTHKSLENIIGFFVNTLAIRIRINPEQSFSDFCKSIHTDILAATEHELIPFDDILAELNPERDTRVPPLFQAMFAFQQFPATPEKLAELRIVNEPVSNSTAKYPLTLTLEQTSDGYTGLLEFNRHLFNDGFIHYFCEHFLLLCNSASEAEELPLHALNSTSAQEIALLANNSKTEYPRDSNLCSEFLTQVQKTTDQIAVISPTETLTYKQLAERVELFAAQLARQNIQSQDRVALLLDRSVDMIALTLAITSLGATYVPIDKRYPAERIIFILNDCAAKLLIHDSHDRHINWPAQIQLDVLKHAGELAAKHELYSRHQQTITPADAAYVMYTSGSTGQPKGVLVSHQNILRLVHGNFLPTLNNARWLHYAPISFDAATLEIWLPLLSGASLVIPPAGLLTSLELRGFIQTYAVNCAWFTVALFNQLVDEACDLFQSMQLVITGGDALSFHHVLLLKQAYPQLVLMNGYGPTENTTFTTTHLISDADLKAGVIPIGKSLSHSHCYVLDEWQQPVGVGIPGELYAAGDGVTLGYLNRPELNSLCFFTDPFSDQRTGRMYKTGDLVSYDESGTLYFHGRLDQQVKIRGFRIELSEIEKHILNYPQIKNTVVQLLDCSLGKVLVAYIEPEQKSTLNLNQLKLELANHLPDYMVPTIFKSVDQLPLTGNGKVDRRALPVVEEADFGGDYVAPSTALESAVSALWSEVLGISRISVQDSFFSLGGHSITLSKLAMRMQAQLKRKIPLGVLFELQTIQQQAAWLEQHCNETIEVIPHLTEAQTPYPLSFAQHRLWFLDQLDPGNTAYNMLFAIKLSGAVRTESLLLALNQICDRHPAIRSNFILSDQQPSVILRQHVNYFLDQQNWTKSIEDRYSLEALLQQERDHAFNLAQEPLLRIRLIQLANNETALIVNMHHIISDGWSMDLFIREWLHCYDSIIENKPIELAPLSIHYYDYAAWQRQKLTGTSLQTLLDYWTQQLHGIPDACLLPADHPRPLQQTFNGSHYPVYLGDELSEKLNTFSKQHAITPFTVLLTAYAIVVGKWSQQSDVCIGIPVAGRTHPQLQNLIGFFVNGLIMRVRCENNPTLQELLKQVQKVVQDGFEHQDLPSDLLLDTLRLKRRADIAPGAQIGFSLQNISRLDQLQFEHFTAESIAYQHITAKYECLLMLEESDQGYTGVIEFNTDLFKAETISRLAMHFKNVLTSLLNETDLPFNALQLESNTGLIDLLNLPKHVALQSLTYTQQDILFDALSSDLYTQHCLGYWLEIPVKIDVERWQEAVFHLTRQQPLLQARVILSPFAWTDPAYLVLDPQQQASFSFIEATATDTSEESITTLIRQLVYRRYDLTSDALVNHYLIKLDEAHYLVVLAGHHLLLDGACFGIHAQALCNIYQQLSQSTPLSKTVIKTPPVLFDGYAESNRLRFDRSETLHYWQQKLQTTEPLSLPGTHANFAGWAETSHTVSPEEWRTVKRFCRQHGTTPARFFKALFGICIAQYTRPEADFYFEEILAGRNGPHHHALGCYFHSQPVYFPKSLLSNGIEITEIVNYIKQEGRASQAFQLISRAGLSSIVGMNRPRVMFNYYHFLPEIQLNNELIFSQQCEPEWDGPLQCVVAQQEDYCTITTKYSHRYFVDSNFSARLAHIAAQVIAISSITIEQLDWLLPHEQNKFLPQHSPLRPATSTAENPTLRAIYSQARQNPNAVAIVSDNEDWTYQTLLSNADLLATHLLAGAIAPGDTVALCLPRNAWAIAAILACAQTGAAYLPIDSQYPVERIHFILRDSGAKALLFHTDTAEKLNARTGFGCNTFLQVDTLSPLPNKLSPAPDCYQPNLPVYCIYTSGSTGQPKGAFVHWHGFENLLSWYQSEIKLKPQDAVLVISSLGFDLTQKNLFTTLCNGGKLIFPTTNSLLDYKEINPLIHRHQIKHINCAPSAFYALTEHCAPHELILLSSLRSVVLGGEPIALERLANFRSSAHCHCYFMNSYGPTECTDVVAFYNIPPHMHSGYVPLGKAVPGNELWVLNELLQPLPPGAVGELHIGGHQVGLGYWQRPALNESRFISTALSATRLYKTGDLVRWREDGLLEYVGRNDFQIKLGGLRIELGEIESALKQHPQIQDAVVVVKNEQLYAYGLLATPANSQQTIDWRTYLRSFVPDYMIPAQVILLSEWPLSPNGKLDRSALPEPANSSAHTYIPPGNAIEQKLVAIWQETLNRSPIGVTDNFFELGGNSLLATRAIAKIRQQFEIEIPLRALFEMHTIGEISKFIAAAEWALQSAKSHSNNSTNESGSREEGLI